MQFASLFRDSPEYERRQKTPFVPAKVTLAQLHAAVPKHLYQKSTLKGLYYAARDISCVVLTYAIATRIDPFCHYLVWNFKVNPLTANFAKWTLWVIYWWWQGIILAGAWCLGHEAGHGTLSSYGWINHAIGFSIHTFLLVPYYAWRSSHQAHHKATGSIERDENYVPKTRSDYGLPPVKRAHITDYHDIFDETPLYTLLRMLVMQFVGFQWYLLTNALGCTMHPPGTNHFSPSSPLFKPHERPGIIASNIGISVMATLLCWWTSFHGISAFVKYYLIPYLLANHWIVMLTFLHHSDPTIPHFRSKQWSFLHGAAATVDRPLLGWIGRFFFHNVSHDHTAHHFFSMIPFYNQPQVTESIKRVLKDDYNYDSTNSFRALYRSFTECCFIEDEGDIVFYKNKHGLAARQVAAGVNLTGSAKLESETSNGDGSAKTVGNGEVFSS